MELITTIQQERKDRLAIAATEPPLVLNPLEHAEWDSSLAANSAGGFFHSQPWCKVLNASYLHRPIYLTRLAHGRILELLPLMEVASPWTGRRGVSLPFTDACPVLAPAILSREELYQQARQQGERRGWSYLEFRGSGPQWPGVFPSLSFWSHIVPLEAGPETVFKNLDGAVRRGIRKAEAAGLTLEFNTSSEAMRLFFSLHCATRRRHGVPPQPLAFFENIARYVFGAGLGFIVIARSAQKAIAAAVFFHWRNQAIYKFGASDLRFQQFRPNNLVMWAAMKKYASEGFTELDLGRTSLVNEGLRRFKAGFGAREEKTHYYRYDLRNRKFVQNADHAEGRLNQLFRCLPSPLFRLAGRVLYPHLS